MICLLCQPSDGWGMMQDVASLCGCLAAVSVQAIYRRTGGLPIVATHIGNPRRQEAVPRRREWGGHRLGKSRVVSPITHTCAVGRRIPARWVPWSRRECTLDGPLGRKALLEAARRVRSRVAAFEQSFVSPTETQSRGGLSAPTPRPRHGGINTTQHNITYIYICITDI